MLMFFLMTLITSVYQSNYNFLLFFAVLAIVVLTILISDSIIPFMIFLSFYGIINRFIFFYTDGFIYSFLFLVPVFIALFFIDEIISNFTSARMKTKIFTIIYLVFILYVSFAFSLKDIVSSGISFIVYFAPVLYAMIKRFSCEDIEKTIKIAFPFILTLFLFQLFNKYFYFDKYYFNKVSSYIFTSLKLGSHYRPFSAFSSSEEFSAFLGLSSIIGLSAKSKYIKIISILSFIVLIILSVRTALVIIIVTVLFYLLRNKKYKLMLSVMSVILLLILISNIFIKDTRVYKTDSRPVTILKHTFEPLKSLTDTYSVRKRIESVQNIADELKNHPFGKGMTHAESVLMNKKQDYPIESSALKLIRSGGLPIFLFLFIVYIISIINLFKRKESLSLYVIFFSLLSLLFMNGLTMHFISVIIIKSIMDGYGL